MKKIISGLSFFLLSIFAMAQNGLESVIVEKYYVSNAADASGSVGTLPAGSVTYRIYADLLPNYKFQALYGVAGHELQLTTSTSFFNNEDRGASSPNGISLTNTTHNTVRLDSWFSVGAAAAGRMGVLKTEDTDGSTGNSDGILTNNDASTGLQILTEDGMIAGTSQPVNFVGIDPDDNIFNNVSQAGNSFISSNVSIASLNGSKGPTSTNRVLIGQFTTDGAFHYELNIQVKDTVTGTIKNFVAKNPVASEISIPSLMGTMGGCSGAPAQPVAVIPNITGNVCNGLTRVYSVAAIAGADAYSWTVPAGGSINGVNNTNVVSVTYGSTFTVKGTISVFTSNGCGTSAVKTLPVALGAPATPGTISGSVTACPTSVKIYSVPAIEGVTYIWSHSGTSISIADGAAPNNIVTVTFGGGFAGDTLKVQATDACGSSALKTLRVGPGTVPAKPTVTYSPNVSKICTGDGVICTTTTVANSFTWSVTSNAVEIYVNGLNKHQSYTGPEKSVILSFLTFTSTTLPCSLTVVAHNECGDNILPFVKVFSNNGPTAPKTIALTSGITKVCPLDTVKIAIAKVTNAIPGHYLWTSDVPGAKIGSVDLFTTGFVGDTIVKVVFTNTFTTTGIKISAKGLNSCGYGVAKALSFTRNTPVVPASLTAQSGSIYGYCNTTSPAVFISAVSSNSTDYVWSWSVANTTTTFVPANPTTYTVGVNFTNFTSGSLTVKGHNQCGVGAAKSLALKGSLLAPVSIDGNPSPCSSTTETYSTNVDGATSYAWTVPANTTINGSKTGASISLTFKSTYAGGNISAKGLNACGTGLAKLVTFTSCGSKMGENGNTLMSELSVYPNPAHDMATVNFNSTASAQYQLVIIDMTSREVLKTEGTSMEGINAIDLNLSNLAKGIYVMNLTSGDNSFQKRIVVE